MTFTLISNSFKNGAAVMRFWVWAARMQRLAPSEKVANRFGYFSGGKIS